MKLDSICLCAIGSNGTGKTTSMIQAAEARERKRGGKVLLVCVKIPNPEILGTYTPILWDGSKTIRVPHKKNILYLPEIAGNADAALTKHLWKALYKLSGISLILDDCGDYEAGNISRALRSLLRMRRQNGINIFFNYHSWVEVPNALNASVNWFVQFQTTDHNTRTDFPQTRRAEIARNWANLQSEGMHAHRLITVLNPFKL